MTVRILTGDMTQRLKRLEANSIDSCVTDPPYHLTSIVKRFGADDAAPAKSNGPTGVYARASKGFMGQTWDGGDVAFRPETWAEVLRVLKPGGHLLAFAASKNAHRLFCAIEDAGFELRDCIMWLYGSGFPKSHNLDGEWKGWGTALKPAYEPIVMARKPLAGTVAKNVEQFGVGAINVYASLVGGSGGRWPANVIHDGSDDVLAAFPDAPGQMADASSSSESRKNQNVYGAMKRGNDGVRARGDSGSAARFFYCAKASKSDRNDGCEGLPKRPGGMVSDTSGQHLTRRDGYEPPAVENHHPTVKPFDLMRYLCRLVTPPNGVVLDPFMGSGSTGKAAKAEGFRFVGIELNPEYVEIARRRIGLEIPECMA